MTDRFGQRDQLNRCQVLRVDRSQNSFQRRGRVQTKSTAFEPAKLREMCGGLKGDSDIARQRAHIGAGRAAELEAQCVARGDFELEILDLNYAGRWRSHINPFARQPVQGHAAPFYRRKHRWNLAVRPAELLFDRSQALRIQRGYGSGADDGALGIERIGLDPELDQPRVALVASFQEGG